MERIVGGKYKLGRKIGSGSFGEIYLGESAAIFSSLTPASIDTFCNTDIFFLLVRSVAATHVDTFEIVAVKIVSSYR